MIDTTANEKSGPIKRTLLMMLAAGVALVVAYGAGEISHLSSFWISD